MSSHLLGTVQRHQHRCLWCPRHDALWLCVSHLCRHKFARACAAHRLPLAPHEEFAR